MEDGEIENLELRIKREPEDDDVRSERLKVR
jgi:hypothetical protein